MIRTYTETYDVNTADGKPTLIGFHTPIGRNPYHFLYPAFMMYEKYKYLGCDVSIVNSAHLPISITAYDIEGGEQNMDPRDSLNPILFKGCHGNSMAEVLDSIYSGFSEITKEQSTDKLELATRFNTFYYTALGDNGWRKSPIQKTLRINGLHPLVYRMAQNIQISPVNMDADDYWENSENFDTNPGNTDRMPGGNQMTDDDEPRARAWNAPVEWHTATGNETTFRAMTYGSSVFTSGVQRLGWMDTLNRNIYNSNTVPSNFSTTRIALLPKVFMGVLMLPPALRAYNFLRISIRHKFAFRGIRGISAGAGDPVFTPTGTNWAYYNQFDAGSVPDSANKKVQPVLSTAQQAMTPPDVDQPDVPCFETIAEDNIELVNAKSS